MEDLPAMKEVSSFSELRIFCPQKYVLNVWFTLAHSDEGFLGV